MTLKGFADLADLPEDDRIRVIGEYVEAHPGEIIGVVVDEDRTGAKATRYIAKVTTLYKVRVLDRGPGPVAHSTLLRFRQRED